MIFEHNKKEKMKVDEFLEIVRKYQNNIETTKHTFFRLNEKQRKIYDDVKLRGYLLNKRPLEVWKQENAHLAAFYPLDLDKDKILKIILNVNFNKIYIVTFYILNIRQRQELGK